MTHLPPTISTEAVYKTADLFKSDSPQVANLLRRSSYVDNLIDSQPSMTTALRTAHKTERMLAKGGFAVKCWQFSGESSRHTGCELQAKDTAYTHESPRSRWNPEKDTVVYHGLLSSMMGAIWPLVLQHTSDGNLTVAITGADSIMAKCRIAQVNKLSTPQMELNAALLSKRGRKVIEKEMRFDF